MRRTSFAPTRRRRSPIPAILILAVLLVFGFLIYLGLADDEAPLRKMEQDVTNEALAR